MRQVDVGEWIRESGLPASTIASRAGINRSQLHRIVKGENSPTVDTLTEIAIACGLEFDPTTHVLSDPDAAAAARFLVDDSHDSLEPTAGQKRWMERLQRICPDGDELNIVEYAGHASSLLARRDAVFLRGNSDVFRVASAGDATKQDWAISGAPLFSLPIEKNEDGFPRLVLHVRDAIEAARFLTPQWEQTPFPLEANLIVVPSIDSVFVDSYVNEGVNVVAPTQMLIDAIGLKGELEQAARQEGETW